MTTHTASASAPTAADVVAAVANLINSSVTQMASMARASQPLVDAYVGALRSAAALPMTTLNALSGTTSAPCRGGQPQPGGCCEIPETTCPPYCVCELGLEGARGDEVAGTITVTNTRKTAQVFTL